MANTFSLSADHQDGVLSLKSTQGPQYSQEHTDDLASKYDLALGSASPGVPGISAAISGNNLDRLNELMSMQKGIDLENTRNTLIQAIANQNSGVVSPESVSAVRALSTQTLTGDPEALGTALEQEYSKRVTNDQLEAINQKTNGAYDAAILTDPAGTAQSLDRAEFQTARNFIANNIYKDVQKKYDDSNILQKGLAWAQTFIPFRSWAAMGNTGKANLPSKILPGDSLEAQYAYMHTLNPTEFKQKAQARVDELISQGDYIDALTWSEGLLSFGNSDKLWANIWAGADVAGVLPAGLLAKGLKGAAKAIGLPLKESEVIAKVTSLEAEAVTVAASKAISEGSLPLTAVRKGEDVERAVASIARPAEAFGGLPKANGIVLSRLQTAMMNRASKAIELLTNVNKIDRLTPAEIDVAVKAAKEDMNKMFVDQSSNLIDLRHNVADNESNIHTVTAVFGKKDGSWFPDEKGAKAWGTRVLGKKTTDWVAVNKGTGYAVEVTKNVDETKAGLRDFTIDTDSKNADTFLTRFMPFVLGADVKLSPAQQAARSVATLSIEKQQHLLEEFGKPIAALQTDKQGFKEWEKFIKTSRDRVDPERGRGVTYHTLQEFEDAWYNQFSKLPTEAQSDAYLSFKQAYDLDWTVRALDVYKQKAVLGIEKFTTKRLVDGKMAEPLTLEGKVVDNLPFGHDSNFRVAVIDENGTLVKGLQSDSRFMLSKSNGISTKDRLEKLMAEEGYTAVQAYDGVIDIGDDYFNFVLMKNFQRERVSMNLGYKEGSRVVQKYPWFIKQARVKINNNRGRYLGDIALANARDAEDGKFILDKMEQLRTTLRDQMAQGNKFKASYPAKTFFEQNFPMWDYADFAKRVQSGEIDLNVPFTLTRSGNRTIDTVSLKDVLNKAGHQIEDIDTGNAWRLSNQVKGRFLGDQRETDMTAFAVEKGSIFELATDSQLSPLETLKLSMGDMIDVNVMNDYKIKSVRDFTSQFGHLLEGNISDFQQNGLKYIFNPVYRSGINEAEKKGAEAVRKAILSLWQHSTPVDRAIGVYKEKIIRSVRTALGDKAAEIANDKVLPTIGNADGLMRAFAFHTKMGFFNPKQLFLQMTSAVNILAISPKFGSKAAMLTSPIMVGLKAGSDDILKGVGAKLASTMGIKPEDYVELVQMYKRSGFDLVSGDVAYLDDLSTPKIVKGKVGQILDAGTSFFRVGERTARTMAFAAAYLERKAAGKALNRLDEAWILKRAKDMTGNMTRDSNAPYQRGYTAIATQFFGYQMRLMEQMFGSKLTGAEKARMFTAMSFLYGIPVGAGMTFGVVPVREWFKQWMASEGVQYDNTLAEPFIDGFAADFLKMVTGTKFDVSSRYGPNGLNNFGDLLTGDASLFNLLMGASGGTIYQTMADSDPIIKGLFSFMNPWDTEKFPIVAQDWLLPLSEVSTANSVIKLWKATNLGGWISKNENKLTDTTPLENWISATLGLEPQRVSDAFTNIDAMNQIKDWQAKDEKQMVADYRRAVQALRTGNSDLAITYFNRVKIRGHSAGFTPVQFNQMYRRAMKDEPLDESVLRQIQQMMSK